MQQNQGTVLRDIVLIGGGHSHVGVLRMFGMNPWPGVRLTVICTDVDTPYSGMLPGYIAGHYTFEEVHIDLGRLCAFAGARLVVGEVTGLDRAQRKVLVGGRPPIAYDLVSINTGSTPNTAVVQGASEYAVPVKPIAQFNNKWQALLERIENASSPLRVAVVGAGAGGVELTLAMQHRLQSELKRLGRTNLQPQFHLLSSSSTILPTHNAGVRQTFAEVLKARGVHLHLNAEVVKVEPGQLHTAAGQTLAVDEVVWVTAAGGPAWLKTTGLELDAQGFVRVTDTLQTTQDELIFAAGDVASMVNHPLEKAGVFAVRMGKPLAENLKRKIQGKALQHYNPQKTWLALISTGDQFAVASKGAIGFSGAWVWQWKDWIDRRFMRKFTEFPAMNPDAPQAATSNTSDQPALTEEESLQAISAIAMRCGGCGAKVGSTVLSRALGQLQPIDKPEVLVGLHAPDDAAIVTIPAGKALVQTVDFFRSFIDDPYVFGRIAANHALGDVFAMGGQAHTATAVVTVPPGLESKVEELLFQMMSGAVEVLNDAGCALVGGHTGEGKELALGFAVNGLIDSSLDRVMIKGGMKPGDAIILTKPVGTGTLFAALPRLATKGRWIDAALRSMQISNREGAAILAKHGCGACTDLTGFGLLGHLVEMTKPSGVDATLNLSQIPWLEGAIDTVKAGIVSSLQPANVRLRRAIRDQAKWVNDPRYALLFDPQTAGGLLATVPADQAQACLAELRNAGYTRSAQIGTVSAQGDALEPVVLQE